MPLLNCWGVSPGCCLQILPPPISKTDFEKVLARQRPTVGKKDLEVHEKFTKEFGEEGWCTRRYQEYSVDSCTAAPQNVYCLIHTSVHSGSWAQAALLLCRAIIIVPLLSNSFHLHTPLLCLEFSASVLRKIMIFKVGCHCLAACIIVFFVAGILFSSQFLFW
jgi:hypothetical protein